MDKTALRAQERTILGKKVKILRKDGIIPGHVYGNKADGEAVSVVLKDFMKIYQQAGETGLVDLKIGDDRSKPVLIRGVQFDPISSEILNIDFYQVNLKEKVRVPVPIVLTGEEPESVKLGEHVILQNLNEVEVEALPTDLIEKIEVNIEVLKQVDDAITVDQLNYDRETLTVLADGEEVVVKLAPAVTEEMKALLEEQEAEAEAAQEAQAVEEGAEAEIEEGIEGGKEAEVSEEQNADSSDSEKTSE